MTAWQIAIETCMRQGSVALLNEDRLVEQIILPAESRTAQSLAPAVARLLAVPPRGGRDVALVSAAVGPGSFTGIRIGVTAAKTLAYALGCPVAPCDTLAAIIRQVRCGVAEGGVAEGGVAEGGVAEGGVAEGGVVEGGTIDAAINAYRGQVYCRREAGHGQLLVASQAKDRQDWLESFESSSSRGGGGEQPIVVAGDVWKQIDRLPPSVVLAAESLWHPLAATVGLLGWERLERGEAIDAMQLAAVYLRASAAEEKAEQKNAAQ